MAVEDCPFCLPEIEPQIVLSDAHCYAIWTQETPEGSGMVLPRAHRPTVFDLTEDEWVSTRRLLDEFRALIMVRHHPDGWNVGWNVEPVGGQGIPHAHCHLVPRYGDEPYAGRGIRAWLKDPANRPARHGPARRPPWLSIGGSG
jgi:diadenosine tetraphosphate (Ap4A) HIT family hydrolase